MKEVCLPCRSPWAHEYMSLKCQRDCQIPRGYDREYYRGLGRLMNRVRIHCFKREGERPLGCTDKYGRTSSVLQEQIAAGRHMESVRR